jgi:hypothetical protein
MTPLYRYEFFPLAFLCRRFLAVAVLLRRPYENSLLSISNPYASPCILGPEQQIEEAPMGVFAGGSGRRAADGAGPQSFWQRTAQALDRVMAQRSERAVPAVVLRRSRSDIARCRRLMLEGAIGRVTRGSSSRP